MSSTPFNLPLVMPTLTVNSCFPALSFMAEGTSVLCLHWEILQDSFDSVDTAGHPSYCKHLSNPLNLHTVLQSFSQTPLCFSVTAGKENRVFRGKTITDYSQRLPFMSHSPLVLNDVQDSKLRSRDILFQSVSRSEQRHVCGHAD